MTSSRQGSLGLAACTLALLAFVASAARPAPALADPSHETFRFTRVLTPAAAGPVRVNVDVPLLSGAEPGAGLRDLRLTADGGEVPFLLVEPRPVAAETWLRGVARPTPPTAIESGFEVDLGRIARVDRLRLGGLPRPLLKQARVEGSGDRAHYTLLVSQATVFDLPDEQLVSLELPLPDGQQRYLRVTWDNRATSALALPGTVEAREVTPTTAPEPLRADVPFERRPSRAGESRFRIRLPASGLPLVAVELSCAGGHLLRPARVSEPQLRGDEVIPVELGHATLRRSTHDGLSASALRVPVAHVHGKELELVVDDGDNAALELDHVVAVLTPQPWIYLEARAATPIVAHYGNARLGAPRYDLEAARAGLDSLHPSVAAWGEPKPEPGASTPEAPPAVNLVGAALEAAGFSVTRSILAGEHPAAGLAAVALDGAALSHSATLADLRIRDATGHQVPYLLEHSDEPTLIDLKLERLAKDSPGAPPAPQGSSLYRVSLPFATLPPGRLVLSTDVRVFHRHVALLLPRAAGALPRDPEWRTLDGRDWTHADPDSPAAPLAVPCSLSGASAVYVKVDEGDNEPLALAGVRLELPGVRLRFFQAADASLTLLYGDPQLNPPRYDLALLAPTLAGAVAAELALGPEATTPAAAPPGRAGMGVFWGALVGAVAILLVMMGVLLRRAGPAAE